MKKSARIIFVFIFIVAVLILNNEVSAQCAMCKAAQNSSGFSSRGLNNGILYLMIIPYIAFSFLAYFWYKASKKQKQQQQKTLEALKGKIN